MKKLISVLLFFAFVIAQSVGQVNEPGELGGATCEAEQNCNNGGKVKCEGSKLCIVGEQYVECDGVKAACL